jgi:hypothetical protein
MIHVPSNKPHIPPPINPKEVGKEIENKPEQQAAKTAKPLPAKANIGRGPELDARALAVRLAALSTEAKEKEISGKEFKRILDEVVNLTGLKDPQAAMEEANKKLQKEISLELEKIKKNKGLMDEAQDWQNFAELLTSMSKEQAESFMSLLKDSIQEL